MGAWSIRPCAAKQLLLAGSLSFTMLGLTGCAATRDATSPARARTSHSTSDLGPYSRKISVSDARAQQAFNDGLNWMYSFNHGEAIRSFTQATSIDPNCAMAWWGIALCLGPHINNPTMDEAGSKKAWDALTRARQSTAGCTAVEQALIEALGSRYVDPAVTTPLPLDFASRAPLDRAYADAMATVYARFPADDDVATLYAEALMDLRPWDLWSVTGEPRPETSNVTSALEVVLVRNPSHPGANHYYIHAVEASPHPERAEAAAERLRTLVPASGHMVHMPSHIDVRLGHWNTAADQNETAIAVHRDYDRRSPQKGLYRAYMFHNDHFLAYACMMAGRRADATAAARAMVGSIPEEFFRDYAPVADAYTPIQVEVLIRFGRWDDVLREPEPRSELPITRAMWRFSRGVALAAKGDPRSAREEQVKFREYVAKVPKGAMMAINPAERVLAIAEQMLEGEILYREGDVDGAVAKLRAAIAIEDTLQYIEPPDWVQPVRHALGAILLESGRPADAADVYREDLRRLPENGWSLYGLARCYRAMGRESDAVAFEQRFNRAWSRADTKLDASCFCATGKPEQRAAARH